MLIANNNNKFNEIYILVALYQKKKRIIDQ